MTSRLLAFSRKQALAPTVVDLNAAIQGVTDLLHRTLGETISIRTQSDPDLSLTRLDRGQFETALLNLAVNARHAMPNGGKLTLETANIELNEAYAARHAEVSPGAYAMVAVSDNGAGMTPEVLEKVFEPFFTTKEVGQGSGRGLSMVYGFVKQSGGHVSIYSEPGEGTTVKLYFPAPPQPQRPPWMALRMTFPWAPERPFSLSKTTRTCDSLPNNVSSLGYNTLTAPDGPAALAILDEGAQVDLLFTDVVLPRGMNGVALAAAARERRPDLRVLYVSSYTENAIVHNGAVDDGIELLNKPYRRRDAAILFRRILAG